MVGDSAVSIVAEERPVVTGCSCLGGRWCPHCGKPKPPQYRTLLITRGSPADTKDNARLGSFTLMVSACVGRRGSYRRGGVNLSISRQPARTENVA